MIPKRQTTMPHQHRLCSSNLCREDEVAVSEVLGVIMMLAMVVSIMGGVWILLNPYISDFEDNTNWNAANGIADRLEDRIDVASDSPNGTGIRHNLAMRTSMLQGVSNVEQWTISADMSPNDVVFVTHHNDSSLLVNSLNNSAEYVEIMMQTSKSTIILDDDNYVTHNLALNDWYVITVFNGDGQAIHRYAHYSISGLRIVTSLGNGAHEIYLVNNARIEHFADSAWEISSFPRIEFDNLATGGTRLSMIITNVVVNSSLGNPNQLGIEIISFGSMSLFSNECYNIRYTTYNSISPVISPQYEEKWLSPYTINRASGTLDSFIGLSPYERASGIDGISVNTLGEAVFFDVTINQVVLQK